MKGSVRLNLLLELGLLTLALCLVTRFTASGGSGGSTRLVAVGAMKLVDSDENFC